MNEITKKTPPDDSEGTEFDTIKNRINLILLIPCN